MKTKKLGPGDRKQEHRKNHLRLSRGFARCWLDRRLERFTSKQILPRTIIFGKLNPATITFPGGPK